MTTPSSGTLHAARTRVGSWILLQFAAVIAGALLLLRDGGRRFLLAYGVGVLFAVAGALALGCGAQWTAWLAHGRRGPLPELEIAGFGALAGLVAGYTLLVRVRGDASARALDALAPSIGAIISVARIGCFVAGCDFGRPSDVPWAVTYGPMTPAFRAQVDAGLLSESALRTLPVHPTQLYESFAGLIVLALVLAVRSPRRSGDRFALAVFAYGALRIPIDILRGDLVHGGALGLTTTQGLALAACGLVIAWRYK